MIAHVKFLGYAIPSDVTRFIRKRNKSLLLIPIINSYYNIKVNLILNMIEFSNVKDYLRQK